MRIIALALGAALLLVSNGHTIAPFATIASAAALIVFLAGERPFARLAIAALIFVVGHCLIWAGIIPAPGLIYYAAASAYGLSHFIPYAAHRLLGASRPSFVFTLAFPAAYVVIEALLEWLTPYGSWSSLAYTQQPDGAFGQFAALGGIPLVTFFVAWTGAILAWLWERRAETKSLAVVLCGVAIGFSALSAIPEFRAGSLGDPGAIVRVVTLSPDPALMHALDREMRVGQITDRTVAAAQALNENLLARTVRAAREGAQIVVWSETAARVLKHDEAMFLEDAAQVARTHDVYLLAAYGAFDRGAARPFENRLAAISPSAGVRWVFDKAHPIIGAEANSVAPGGAVLPTLDTPYGRVGVIICHDADFPAFVRQAARQSVDLLVNPADDWPVIQFLHANMARYRAVENGVTLLRAANGVSFIADPLGRTLAMRNSLSGDGLDLVAAAPIRRAPVYQSGALMTRSLAGLVLCVFAAGTVIGLRRRRT